MIKLTCNWDFSLVFFLPHEFNDLVLALGLSYASSLLLYSIYGAVFLGPKGLGQVKIFISTETQTDIKHIKLSCVA